MDESVRRELHQQLDCLLDRRAELDPPDLPAPNSLGALAAYAENSAIDLPRARLVFREVLVLARAIMGDRIRAAVIQRDCRDGDDQRDILASWLLQLSPILNMRQPLLKLSRQLTVFEVVDAISALDAGEIQPIFAAKTGKNRRANRWTLARAKLEALAWKKRLLVLGHHEKSANFEITKAFGEQWDTIRKWKAQCEQILGEHHVRVELEFAGGNMDPFLKPPPARAGMFGGRSQDDPLKLLEGSGEKYRRELARSAELSRRKVRVKTPPDE